MLQQLFDGRPRCVARHVGRRHGDNVPRRPTVVIDRDGDTVDSLIDSIVIVGMLLRTPGD